MYNFFFLIQVFLPEDKKNLSILCPGFFCLLSDFDMTLVVDDLFFFFSKAHKPVQTIGVFFLVFNPFFGNAT